MQLLNVDFNTLKPIQHKSKFGNEVYPCLQGENLLADVTTGQTIIDYWGKNDYKTEPAWNEQSYQVS